MKVSEAKKLIEDAYKNIQECKEFPAYKVLSSQPYSRAHTYEEIFGEDGVAYKDYDLANKELKRLETQEGAEAEIKNSELLVLISEIPAHYLYLSKEILKLVKENPNLAAPASKTGYHPDIQYSREAATASATSASSEGSKEPLAVRRGVNPAPLEEMQKQNNTDAKR